MSSFPLTRHRRLRQAPWIRALVQETRLHPSDFIQPLFVQEGEEDTPIAALHGQYRWSIAGLVEHTKACASTGIQAVALFPVTKRDHKDENGAEALNPDNLICRAIRTLKQQVPEIGIIADVALDPYTSHGHDGIRTRNGDVDNDVTVATLCKQALTLAQAGADILAPSDMMDGRIGAIRTALEQAGYPNIMLLSYAAKYASPLYGAFRDAVGSAQSIPPDKRGYQMNPANRAEALSEVAMDIAEGADMVMVKPALPYLDVIRAVREAYTVPVFAYQVGGEYAALVHGAAAGAFHFEAALDESLLSIKRAGATAILSYAALDVARRIG